MATTSATRAPRNTTARKATATEKQVSKAESVATLDTVVTAYKTASGNTAGVEGQMLSLDEQRRVLRVWQARAAVAVFRHPEVGEKMLTAANAVGESRTTFRRFVEGGLKLKNPLSTDAPTAHEIKQVNAGWEKVAADQKKRDDAPKKDTEKVSKVGQSEGEGEGESKAPEAPTFKDVMRATKAVATAIQALQNEKGALTKQELQALKTNLQLIINDASKGAVQNAAK